MKLTRTMPPPRAAPGRRLLGVEVVPSQRPPAVPARLWGRFRLLPEHVVTGVVLLAPEAD